MTSPMPVPPYPHPAPPGAWPRSPAALARATAVLLGLVVATDLFACYADLLEMDVTKDLVDGVVGDDVIDRADHADDLYGLSGILQGVALVATMVVYLCWLWRVRVNAGVFDASRHRMRLGWTIGGWFCPVVNLWFPRRIVADTWDASGPWGARSGHALVNAWWALWLVDLLVGRFADTRSRRAETAEELYESARAMLLSDALDIVAAVLAVLVVVRLSRLQERKLRSEEMPFPAPPPAPALG
ncbi:DUF4328 domain-containing protein [Streptomyces lavenduligriseus]|nr:DUF4328 domain-containing protein [Streptomyces lavenduligriseus]